MTCFSRPTRSTKCPVISKEEGVAAWLYRYVFRGIGVVMVIGMITILFLAVSSQLHRTGTNAASHTAEVHR